jgi:CDP-diacylglycerol--glycerol-3-phosphate 3-phosphatidyltransferase
MFDRRWRSGVERGLEPVGSTIRRTGISADHLTASGLVLAGACAVAIGTGRLGLGLVLLIASALPDLLDGAVAKAAQTASARGAFFDSVADRVSDSLVLGGIAWYLSTTRGGAIPVLPFAVLAASMLVSYERARAESLGYTAKGGLMERAERVIALAISLAFHAVMIPVLWVMLALTLVTAVQRFAMVWQQSSSRPEEERRLARWRAWRTAHGYGDVDLGRPWRRRAADAADRLRRSEKEAARQRRSEREAARAAARERRGERRATRTRP